MQGGITARERYHSTASMNIKDSSFCASLRAVAEPMMTDALAYSQWIPDTLNVSLIECGSFYPVPSCSVSSNDSAAPAQILLLLPLTLPLLLTLRLRQILILPARRVARLLQRPQPARQLRLRLPQRQRKARRRMTMTRTRITPSCQRLRPRPLKNSRGLRGSDRACRKPARGWPLSS
jgi:hypothetical protein